MSESPVLSFLNKLADLLLLNALWLSCCIPVVTIGAATTAMYYVCIISIRNGDGYVVRRFFKSFRENFKTATILWLLMLLFGAILGADLFFWYVQGSLFAKLMFVLSAIVAVLVGIVALWCFPVLSKLDGTLKQTVVNAAKFSIAYLPYTAMVLLITGIFGFANLKSIAMNAISFFVGFSVLAYVQSFFFYKVFMNHIEERFDDFIKIVKE